MDAKGSSAVRTSTGPLVCFAIYYAVAYWICGHDLLRFGVVTEVLAVALILTGIRYDDVASFLLGCVLLVAGVVQIAGAVVGG